MIELSAVVRRHWPPPSWVWPAIDAVGAAALATNLLTGMADYPGAPIRLGQVLAVVLCLGVALRRVAPLPVLGAVAVASAVTGYVGLRKDPMIALALVLYVVAVRASRTMAVVALATAEGAVFVAAQSHAESRMPPIAITSTAVVQAAAWALGVAARSQRAYTAGLRRQAAERVQAEIDRAARTLVEERLRIARDLHDIVAHTMSVIAVQASVGAHVAGTSPEDGRAMLRTIEETSRHALRDLRAMLSVLRERGEPAAGDPPTAVPQTPTPDLDRLPELLAGTRAAGPTIDLAVSGTPRPLAAAVELTAYRIVQEALTNVVRHAGSPHVVVDLDYQPDSLVVTVTDDGGGTPARPAAGGGHGLVGIAERVALTGGTVTAGPRLPRGFRVRAVLPFADRTAGAVAR